MIRFALPLLLMFVLAACAPSQVTMEPPTPGPPTSTDDLAIIPTVFPNGQRTNELSRIDEQGAIIFEVTPLNLGTPADTLEFDVAMNTHSVDLSMDLAAASTVATDTGVIIQASKWDAIPGGHHVEGTLIFPTRQNGRSILEGASKLTLTIVNVDAASRVFEWDLK